MEDPGCGNHYPVLTFKRRQWHYGYGISCRVEVSDDLVTWENDPSPFQESVLGYPMDSEVTVARVRKGVRGR